MRASGRAVRRGQSSAGRLLKAHTPTVRSAAPGSAREDTAAAAYYHLKLYTPRMKSALTSFHTWAWHAHYYPCHFCLYSQLTHLFCLFNQIYVIQYLPPVSCFTVYMVIFTCGFILLALAAELQTNEAQCVPPRRRAIKIKRHH